MPFGTGPYVNHSGGYDYWRTWFIEECDASQLFGVTKKHLGLITLDGVGLPSYRVGTRLSLEDAPYFRGSKTHHRICGPYEVFALQQLPEGVESIHIINGIDYKPDGEVMREIKKHVVLRNCMQHHEGRLDRDSMLQLGCDKVEMQGDKGNYSLEVWKKIIFSENELYALCAILRKFVDNFHDHVKKRVPTMHYMSGPQPFE